MLYSFQVETSFFHIDSSHDLGIVLLMHGFKRSNLKFPRAETFSGIAKFSGTKYSISETVTFEPDFTDGNLSLSRCFPSGDTIFSRNNQLTGILLHYCRSCLCYRGKGDGRIFWSSGNLHFRAIFVI